MAIRGRAWATSARRPPGPAPSPSCRRCRPRDRRRSRTAGRCSFRTRASVPSRLSPNQFRASSGTTRRGARGQAAVSAKARPDGQRRGEADERQVVGIHPPGHAAGQPDQESLLGGGGHAGVLADVIGVGVCRDLGARVKVAVEVSMIGFLRAALVRARFTVRCAVRRPTGSGVGTQDLPDSRRPPGNGPFAPGGIRWCRRAAGRDDTCAGGRYALRGLAVVRMMGRFQRRSRKDTA